MRLTWTLLGGIGLGAGLMYFLDPQRGVRRRVMIRHITRVIHATPVRLNSIALDRRARAGGWAAHTGTRLRPAANINWVFGPGEKPQTWMPPPLYFLLVMTFFPFGIYPPTHLLLLRWCG